VLAVVSVFTVIVVALAAILGLILQSKRRSDAEVARTDEVSNDRLRDWRSHEFMIWDGRMLGIDAIIEMLLPIGAVAFGMTAFAVVLHFATA